MYIKFTFAFCVSKKNNNMQSSLKLILSSFFIVSVASSKRTSTKSGIAYPGCNEDLCEDNEFYRKKVMKVYLMGPVGVGKSTFSNYLTGHSDSSQCYETARSLEAKTKIVSDRGCHYYFNSINLNNKNKTKIIVADTPGLDDSSTSNIQIVGALYKYHNHERKNEDVTSFIVLIDGSHRLRKSIKDMFEEYVQSFGPSFWKYLTIVISRGQVAERRQIEKWKKEDKRASQKNKGVKWGYRGVL